MDLKNWIDNSVQNSEAYATPLHCLEDTRRMATGGVSPHFCGQTLFRLEQVLEDMWSTEFCAKQKPLKVTPNQQENLQKHFVTGICISDASTPPQASIWNLDDVYHEKVYSFNGTKHLDLCPKGMHLHAFRSCKPFESFGVAFLLSMSQGVSFSEASFEVNLRRSDHFLHQKRSFSKHQLRSRFQSPTLSFLAFCEPVMEWYTNDSWFVSSKNVRRQWNTGKFHIWNRSFQLIRETLNERNPAPFQMYFIIWKPNTGMITIPIGAGYLPQNAFCSSSCRREHGDSSLEIRLVP